MLEKVFVYGTLMKNRSNHHLLENQKFIGTAIAEGIALYNVIPHYPGAVRKPNSKVLGEVYEVDEVTLLKLDELEDNGVLYKRELIPVIVLNSKNTLNAWIYLWLREISEDLLMPFDKQPWKPIKIINIKP
ncbi:gamma-glutamylcyclotransferase [Peptococcaceae bacterium]|nr:gamma-glutamylcyclotransferase [Peptococcaceae bacterium]